MQTTGMTSDEMPPMHRLSDPIHKTHQLLVLLVICLLTATTSLAVAPFARADFGVAAFDGEVVDENGDAFTQAGGHPYAASTVIDFNTTTDAHGNNVPDGSSVKEITVDLPAGLVGNPAAVATCRDFLKDLQVLNCPDSTQVGVATLTFSFGPFPFPFATPIYNLEPSPGTPAAFGFNVGSVPVLLEGGVRTDGDYGLRVVARNVSQALAVLGTEITFWGVPADARHDAERGDCLLSGGLDPDTGLPCPSDARSTPFLTNPTACTPPGVGLETTLQVRGWRDPSLVREGSFVSHLPPGHPNPPGTWGPPQGPTGCDQVPFDPSIVVTPHKTLPDSPSGYSVDLRIPDSPNPDGIAQSHLKRAVVAMPEGVTLNPSAADGLVGCSDDQIALKSAAAPRCPDGSRVGTVTIDTPLLREPMTGSIFVGTQLPNDRYRIFLVADGSGVVVKLAGSIRPDPRTGQLTTTFDDNPQLPFEHLHLEFNGGPRAPLANPATCGVKTVSTELTPWSGNAPAHPSSSFTIDCPGVEGFSPTFIAGTAIPTGGAFSPFVASFHRQDRQEYLGGITVKTPPGLIAKLKDVFLCSDPQAAAGACPAESHVGTATVGAGVGSNPFFLQGPVSLTGPYKGAPYGLVVAVRVIAGPFDLGTVVVRQAIQIDPDDAHLTIVSDPLPTILEGVPIRLRSVNVAIDRSDFVTNPTSCREKQISATMSSVNGATHTVVQRFQVGDCQALALRPRLRLRLAGRRQMREGRHPGFRAVLTQPAGQANLRQVAVKLPLSLALDPENARGLCEYEDGLRADCPDSSIIGSARAVTPVLSRPLTGPVYFVKGVRVDRRTGRRIRTLPTLLITLRGEVAINLRASSRVRRRKLVSTFNAVPDAPVSRFSLKLRGGKGGILVVTAKRGICERKQVARVNIDGQNGKRADRNVRLRSPCKRR